MDVLGPLVDSCCEGQLAPFWLQELWPDLDSGSTFERSTQGQRQSLLGKVFFISRYANVLEGYTTKLSSKSITGRLLDVDMVKLI